MSKKNKSPLRYVGGKTRAISILERYVNQYYGDKTVILSPFFGGGSFELYMKQKNYRIIANDLFEPLYVFWSVLQKDRDLLIEEVRQRIPVTKDSFVEMRKNILTNTNDIDIASMYFCINRSSFSGATLCGGFSKQASEQRLTESSIDTLKRCDVTDIVFKNMDCVDFLHEFKQTESTLLFSDPPYYIERYMYGKDGDMHKNFDHESFAEIIKQRDDWILTYNDCDYIRQLYKDCHIFEESWSYGMNSSKKSSEIIILP